MNFKKPLSWAIILFGLVSGQSSFANDYCANPPVDEQCAKKLERLVALLGFDQLLLQIPQTGIDASEALLEGADVPESAWRSSLDELDPAYFREVAYKNILTDLNLSDIEAALAWFDSEEGSTISSDLAGWLDAMEERDPSGTDPVRTELFESIASKSIWGPFYYVLSGHVSLAQHAPSTFSLTDEEVSQFIHSNRVHASEFPSDFSKTVALEMLPRALPNAKVTDLEAFLFFMNDSRYQKLFSQLLRLPALALNISTRHVHTVLRAHVPFEKAEVAELPLKPPSFRPQLLEAANQAIFEGDTSNVESFMLGLERLIEANPEDLQALILLGRFTTWQAWRGEAGLDSLVPQYDPVILRKARSYLERALQVDQSSVRALRYLGNVAFFGHDLGVADQHYSDAQRLGLEDDGWLIADIAALRFEQQRIEDAVSGFVEAMASSDEGVRRVATTNLMLTVVTPETSAEAFAAIEINISNGKASFADQINYVHAILNRVGAPIDRAIEVAEVLAKQNPRLPGRLLAIAKTGLAVQNHSDEQCFVDAKGASLLSEATELWPDEMSLMWSLSRNPFLYRGVLCLVRVGVNPNRASRNHENVLAAAIYNQDVDLARGLIDAGVDVNMPGGGLLTYPLSLAVAHSNVELTQLLLDRGADPSMKNTLGRDAVAHINEESPQAEKLRRMLQDAGH